ncbi:MAG: tetratricopeptide repeat protein [Tetrasphaera sp.]
MTGRELDREVWTQLRTLSKENAEGVAQHLVMVAIRLAEEDVDGALAHAETAVRRAGRVPAAREALGMVAYRQGEFARALAEFRTVRRLSGSAHLLPLMVDCERGLGRLDRALELAVSAEAAELPAPERAELAMVVSGVRRDLGQLDAAVVGLEPFVSGPVRPWSARAYYAYADALLARGEEVEARRWFAAAVDADTEVSTDAAERLDLLDGVAFDDACDESLADHVDLGPQTGVGESEQ